MYRFPVFLLALVAHGAIAETLSLRVARYSTLHAVPDPAVYQLLDATVDGDFPASVRTVADALDYALAGSGYRVIETAARAAAPLMPLPLPANHRTLGSTRLSLLLQILAGPAHTVIVDRRHRLIALEPCPYSAMRSTP